MKDYRKILQFYYKGNSYNMYLDNHNKHFFLRNNADGTLSYVTIDELIELSLFFTNVPLVMNAKKDSKSKIVPKVIIGGVSVTLSLTLLNTVLGIYKNQGKITNLDANKISSSQTVEQDMKDYISFNDYSIPPAKNKNQDTKEDNPSTSYPISSIQSISNIQPIETEEDDKLVVDTYLESDWLNYLYVYDMDYLDRALDYKKVDINQVKALIKNNNSISDKFKNLLYEYCDELIEKYPNIELRVLYENLKTLKVVECDKRDLVRHSLSMDSYGCYIRSENAIYVLDDYDYVKGTWAYQVIFHELSHCLRTGDWNINGKDVKVQVEGQNFYNTTTSEALNSLFAVSLFDYDEKDIAYQLQSNYHSVMLECMDNYKLDDYVTHSLSYYANKLDEFNNDENYAVTILELIQAQYDDYHSTSISVEQNQYYPIYDYISEMYYKKYLNPEMTYSEATKVTDELINKIMFDVPEDYNIDINHFYEYLNEYCDEIGIAKDVKFRN